MGNFSLNTVTSQTSDVVLTVLEGPELKVAYENYHKVFGLAPAPEDELTAEQLTAVKKLLDGDFSPFVDFAVWGPTEIALCES